MIETITIKNEASYGSSPEVLSELSKHNFIYGANGSGKTTISRVVAQEDLFTDCNVIWKGGSRLETMVYNRDFVENNFGQSIELKGIFTLGEKDKKTLEKIAEEKINLDNLTKDIEKLKVTLEGDDGNGGKLSELTLLEEEFESACWDLKLKYDDKLQGAFTGVRGKKKDFKNKLLTEAMGNSAVSKSLDELVDRANTVFGERPQTAEPVTTPVFQDLLDLESKPILLKKVIGKSDVDIAAMINKLGNSDWVKEGRKFYDVNDEICPFCQQSTEDSLSVSLNEYFDEAFEKDTNEIEKLYTDYQTISQRLALSFQTVLDAELKFIDLDKLKTEKDLFDSKIRFNIKQIEKKRKESSLSIELDSISNILTEIKKIFDESNDSIKTHNQMVDNLSQEQIDLTNQIWKYLLDNEIKTGLATYQAKKAGVEKAITAINSQLTNKKKERINKEIEIRELEKDSTSIQPTIDSINSLLMSFGFHGFKLEKSEKDRYYKIVRSDGTDAKETLSEGEKTFITFLYFYHLLKGSETESGMTTDRVVVIDDPVSSLDSDILFIVSSLIKGLFDEVRSDNGHVKQVFVLTHNVYFHKEVTFNPRRTKEALNEETFWVVKKASQESKLQRHNANPIKTSYELLWEDVRNPARSNLSIQNTLRRILENYFKILGNIDPDSIVNLFEGKDKLICKSLFSWVNDGSHSAHDDLYVSIDDAMVENYLKVFEEVFIRTEHLPHYKMMMGDDYEEPYVDAIVEAEQEGTAE